MEQQQTPTRLANKLTIQILAKYGIFSEIRRAESKKRYSRRDGIYIL